MIVVPVGDRVVIKPDELQEVTKSGIYIAHSREEKPHTGVVTAVGPGMWIETVMEDPFGRLPMDVEVGNRVVYGKHAGTEVYLDDELFLILRERDVLAVIEEAEDKPLIEIKGNIAYMNGMPIGMVAERADDERILLDESGGIRT